MIRAFNILGLIGLLMVTTAAYHAPENPANLDACEFIAAHSSTDDAESNKKMAKLAKSCYKCHAAPVSDLFTDKAWVNSIPETT